jgi:hypothetical protein
VGSALDDVAWGIDVGLFRAVQNEPIGAPCQTRAGVRLSCRPEVVGRSPRQVSNRSRVATVHVRATVIGLSLAHVSRRETDTCDAAPHQIVMRRLTTDEEFQQPSFKV